MKKKQVDNVLGKQNERLKKIRRDIILILVLGVISILCFLIFFYKNKPKHIKFKENSFLNYDVYLNDNDFFDNDYLNENNQYISSLIKNIKAKFEYNLELEEELNYEYDYFIEADVSVKDKETNKNLYNFKENLLDNKSNHIGKNISIKDTVNVDYNKYNDLVKRFVSIYDLNDSYSVLTINLHVSVLGNCNKYNPKDALVSLSIPLNTQTVSIDISEDLIEDNFEDLFCKTNSHFNYIYLGFGLAGIIIDIILAISSITYMVNTRTALNIYERKLRKILSNYRSYIQKVNNDFNFVDYQLLKVDTFSDMLEIRDITQEPILMIENQTKTGVYFLIPSKTKILYCYGLKVKKGKDEK